MLFAESVYVGVELASGHQKLAYAALDRDLNPIALENGGMEEIIAFLGGHKSVTVAVNAPSHVNHGLVRKHLEEQSLTQHQLHGVDLRSAEYELRKRGITVRRTEARETLCPAWVRSGFALYENLSNLGFKSYSEDGASHRWLETHPQACFCVLLGGSLLPRQTMEGRLQRALILYERGVRINDPMIFFEEITRHRILNGTLPFELIYLPGQLDALVAAYTAWLAVVRPQEVTHVGNRPEGFITLPSSALKEKY